MKKKDEAPKTRKPSIDASILSSVGANTDENTNESLEPSSEIPSEMSIDETIAEASTQSPIEEAYPVEEPLEAIASEVSPEIETADENTETFVETDTISDLEVEEDLSEAIKENMAPAHKTSTQIDKKSRKKQKERKAKEIKAVNESYDDIDPDVLTNEQPAVKETKKTARVEKFVKNEVAPVKLELDSKDGLVATNENTPKEKKKSKKLRRFVIVAVIIMLAIIGSTLYFEAGIMEKLQSPLIINGQYVDSAEFSFMYHYVLIENGVDVFDSETQAMLLAPSDDPNFSTNRDYFLDLTAKQMQTTQILYDDALSYGYKIEDSHYALARAYVDWLAVKADELGVSLDTYIRGVFGDQVDEQCVVNTLAKMYFTEDYASDEKLVQLQASSTQAEEAYNANPNAYDLVDYKILRITYEQRDEAFITTANLHANAIIEAMGHDQSLFEMSAAEYFSGETHERLLTPDSTLVSDNRYSDMTHTEIRDWLFDASRVSGDCTIFPDSDGFPIIVCFVARDRQYDPLRNVRIVQVNVGNEETGEGLGLADAQALAQEIYDYIDEEANVLEVENLYTDYVLNGTVTVSQSTDTYRGKFDEVIDTWIYTNGRAAGDKVLLDGDGVFYVVYVVSESTNSEWYDRVNSFIRMNNYQAYINEMQTEYTYEFIPAGLDEIQDVP